MSKLNTGKVSIITLTVVFVLSLFVFGKSSNNISAQTAPCGTHEYTFNNDDNNGRVDVDFEDNDHRIDVSGVNGWTVTKVELDVEDDGHSGYHQYSTGNLNNFNPNPGDDINSARVTVTKSCSTPTATPTATATAIATATPTATPEGCKGDDCEQESTPTPTATPDDGDVCHNIDGIQTGIPGDMHLDTTGVNCLNWDKDGGDGKGCANNDCSGNKVGGGAPQGQVLGASTMAKTGGFAEVFYQAIMGVGATLTAFGTKGLKKGKKASK